MRVATMTNILRALEGHILTRRCVGDTLSPHLLLLEPGMKLSAQYTYLGTPEVLGALQCEEPATVILAAPKGCGELPKWSGSLVVTDLELIPLYNLMAKAVTDSGEQTLSNFFSDLFENRLQDIDELEQRAAALPKKILPFISCIVIRRMSPADPVLQEQMLRDLAKIFPQDNFGFYKNDIVILHSMAERLLGNFDWDADALTEYLHKYEAYCGVSHATRFRNHLQTLWRLASETVHLGRIMQRDGMSDCIYAYQDYGMYYIIDLCANEFLQVHNHDDLIYLVHPAIIAICRYDNSHNTNLRDVLFYYLLSHCSLNKTAQRLYMHRNTVLNKLNKIEEITHLSIQDGYLQVYLIFSCLIMRYYERYLGKQVAL